MVVRLAKDAISDLGCNVVTGIVAESLFNADGSDKHLYINVLTLYRNFISCIEGDADSKLRMFKSVSKIKELIKLFEEDTLIFVNACVTNNIKVTIYELDYSKIYKTFSNYKQAGEFKGVRYYKATTQDAASKAIKNAMTGIYKVYGTALKHEKKMFITTHIGIDLLPLTKYDDVTLVESHTGEFKDRLMFYTKLKKLGKNDMSVIPFNEAMYRIFGDNENIKAENISTRKFIYEVGKTLNWYQGLTSNEVLHGITRKDSSLGNRFRKMFKLIF